MKWLRLQQAPSGLFGTAASHDFIYGHAIASYAMCEAYGLSDHKTLRKTAQELVTYLKVTAQDLRARLRRVAF